ncbi:hypothetical protein DP939_19335 [Spongiactinospora rosea]|uniref:GerMN domain-containing protein n=1 Tax=Spongiactinospora rosea TaxID=2248750 RepID=A0A366LYI4_9ACTN|nr:hypothetical protein [Spongiactinospora rosea]RBQ18640.1 hypothetical protein DP939_19335 [Spongiactinospora rosea]
MKRARWMAAALLLAAPLGCGIEAGGVADHGHAPVVSFEPTFITVYLLRGQRLAPARVSAASNTIEDIVTALFKASDRLPPGMDSDLRGFTLRDSQLSRYGQVARNDPDMPRGFRLHIFVVGEGELSRTAQAQLTCTTAGLRSREIWLVQITQMEPDGAPHPRGEYVCSDFRDLASPDTQLPP